MFYPHSNFCPAESKFCNRCGNKGHFVNCCRINLSVLPTQDPVSVKQNVYQNLINQITYSSSNPNVI